METKLSVADLEADLSDLFRSGAGGARVVVERDGVAIAVIVPPEPDPVASWRRLAEAMRDVPTLDEDFAKDVGEVRATQQPVRVLEWPD